MAPPEVNKTSAACCQSVSAMICKAAQWPVKPALKGKPTNPNPPSRKAALFQGKRLPAPCQALFEKPPECCDKTDRPAAAVIMLMVRRPKRKRASGQLRTPGTASTKIIKPQSCNAE